MEKEKYISRAFSILIDVALPEGSFTSPVAAFTVAVGNMLSIVTDVIVGCSLPSSTFKSKPT